MQDSKSRGKVFLQCLLGRVEHRMRIMNPINGTLCVRGADWINVQHRNTSFTHFTHCVSVEQFNSLKCKESMNISAKQQLYERRIKFDLSRNDLKEKARRPDKRKDNVIRSNMNNINSRSLKGANVQLFERRDLHALRHFTTRKRNSHYLFSMKTSTTASIQLSLSS